MPSILPPSEAKLSSAGEDLLPSAKTISSNLPGTTVCAEHTEAATTNFPTRSLTLRLRPTSDRASMENLSDCFTMVDSDVRISEVPKGAAVVRVDWLGFQPSQLKALQAVNNACMTDSLGVGDVPPAYGIGTVVFVQASAEDAEKSPGTAPPVYNVGDLLWADLGWREHVVLTKQQLASPMVRKLDRLYPNPSHFLSVFGAASYTAYFGFLDVARAKENEIVVVSSAAGAVGQIVCQLAMRSGCRVIAITSSVEKAEFLREQVGVSDVLVAEDDPQVALSSLPPFDVFWDNVGGPILDTVLPKLKKHGRVIACGRISEYNAAEKYRLQNWDQLLLKQARWEGFLVTDYITRFAEAEKYFRGLVSTGEVVFHEDILEGLEQCPAALAKLFLRTSMGKVLVKVV